MPIGRKKNLLTEIFHDKRMKKKIYLFVLLTLCVCGLRAEYVAPSEGVFRIINAEYKGVLSETFIGATLKCEAAGDDTDYDQMWIIKKSGNYYTLRNAYSGRYIQTGQFTHEEPYFTDTQAKEWNIMLSSKGNMMYNILDYTKKDPDKGQYVGLHAKGATDKVVRWMPEASKASEWYFEKVNLTEEDLKDVCLGLIEEALVEALPKYFEDAACTKLNSQYASLDEAALRATMEADGIHEALIDMAVKVKGGDWTEANENDKPQWDSDYAKKFRVQLVEPHSIAGEITSWFGYNAHSSMDNPTGVYVNKGETIYIMVEGEIKEGSELWASFITGHSKMPNYTGRFGNGHRLHSGVNMIPCNEDSSAIYINYLVHTYDANTGTFPHKLSEYDDLKVHFAGGHINSYYNAYGDELYKADTDADWMYYEERANLRNITILGKYQVLQFELNDVIGQKEYDDNGNLKEIWGHRGLAKLFPEELPTSLPENQRINAIVEAWDRIMLSELMTLGVAKKSDVDAMNALYPRWDGEWKNKAEIYNYDGYAEFCEGRDYGEYYNHRGLAFGTRTGYMYGSWDHCGYHINTTPAILTQIATEKGATWGPGHEIGHQHQGIFTVNGLTEVTNNLFANIAVWYMGMGTSRLNATEGRLEDAYYVYRTGGDFFGYETKQIWVQTQMYYRLWLYYHRIGNDTQFYPKLFELLRRNPMSKGYAQPGKTTLLHFYQLCCDAAQEDLTEFFRAYGFFRVLKNRFVGDYSDSEYTQSQADIDEAIAAVKAKGYPENKKVLFINDATPDPTYSHDGKTQRIYWDDDPTANWGAGYFPTSTGENAEIGCYVDFMSKEPLTGKYLYTLTDLSVKIEGGDGALGFAIYNNEGEIQAFSNHHNFVVTEEVADMLSMGEARVVAVAAVEGEVEILSSAVSGSESEQQKALRDKIAEAKKYLEMTDATGEKVGLFIPDSTTALAGVTAKAEKALNDNDQTGGTYGEWYARLDKELTVLLNNDAARVPVYANCYYAIFAKENKVYSISYDKNGLRATSAGIADYGNQWQMVPAAEEGTYYLKNRESGYYISAANDGVRAKAAASDVNGALAFRLVAGEPGEFKLQRVDNAQIGLRYSDRQVQGGQGTWWNLTLADDMLGLPEEGTDGKVIIYNIQCVDNEGYLYYNDNKRNGGRVQTS